MVVGYVSHPVSHPLPPRAAAPAAQPRPLYPVCLNLTFGHSGHGP